MHSLTNYVIAVVVVLAAVIGIARLTGGPSKAQKVFVFAAGFLAGMFAMFIAVHVYR